METILQQNPSKRPDCIIPAIKRFFLGVLYLSIFQIVQMYVSDDYLVTEEFNNNSFAKKMFLLGVWGRITLYKYISCWLLTEGACIMFGKFKSRKQKRNKNTKQIFN